MTEGPRRRVAELADGRELRACWRFPAAPLIVIELDGRPLAAVDYVEASSSTPWALRGEIGGHEVAIALPGLAGCVPEELDGDVALRIVALDHALAAGADRLGHPLEGVEVCDG